LLTRG